MAQQRIAFVGLGSMGQGIAGRLAESGFDVTVYNRTAAKAEPVVALGARLAGSPAEAAAEADVVMLSVANERVVEQMLFGDDGAISTLRPGAHVVDLSTVPPRFARELAQRVQASGHHSLDACILGNNRHARSGELRVMVGGEEGDFSVVEPVLAAIGKEVRHLGASGLGATMKLVLNLLMGVEMQALAEAIVFGERAGLPRAAILDMIAKSGYSAPVMGFKCGAIGRRSFNTVDFRLSLMRKDMVLVLDECRDLEVPMPVCEATYTMLTAAGQRGLGDFDCAAIVALMEELSGVEGYPWPAESGSQGPG